MAGTFRWRTTAVLGLCAALSILFGTQALSGVIAKRDPVLALQLFPWNGEAQERQAFGVFQSAQSDGKPLSEAAAAAFPMAKHSLRSHPLSPDAHAVAILSAKDAAAKARMIELASGLNRRDANLQGLVLEDAISTGSERRAIVAIDQILRVNARYATQLFPLLIDALKQPDSADVFLRYMDGSASWHEDFYFYALRDEAALPPLAQARETLEFLPETFDARLIEGLVELDQTAKAREVYALASGPKQTKNTSEIDWKSDYPPLDWRFAENAGFRAQSSLTSTNLEIDVAPGKGGVIASKLIEAPSDTIQVSVTVFPSSGETASDLRLALRCKESKEVFGEMDLQAGPNNRVFLLEKRPACENWYISVYARVLRGQSPLKAELSRISIEPQ